MAQATPDPTINFRVLMKNLTDWLDYIGTAHTQTIDMGLDRMSAMVQRLDLSRPAPTVVTVAGTNGKGSTCMSLEQLLLRGDRTVGATLSPHVSRFNERIRINGEELEDAAICNAFVQIERVRADLPLTYFEFAALAALYCFKHASVDVAILEIGLGGRLDAFNAVDADIAVITSIGLDHQSYLGDSLEAIGAEKAGILRAGQKVVLGPDMPHSVMAACAALQVEPAVYGVDFSAKFIESSAHPATWEFQQTSAMQALTVSALPHGGLAPQNIALAMQAAWLLGVDLATIAPGLGEITMPGRMQQIEYAQRRLVLDVAHNPAGGSFLAAELKRRRIEPALVVCGMLADKNHAATCTPLARQYNSTPWVVVSTTGERAMAANDLLATLAEATPFESTDITPAANMRALKALILSATKPGDVILAFGSFNLVELCQTLDSESYLDRQIPAGANTIE